MKLIIKIIKMDEAMNAAPVPFVMAMVLGTIKRPKLTNISSLENGLESPWCFTPKKRLNM